MYYVTEKGQSDFERLDSFIAKTDVERIRTFDALWSRWMIYVTILENEIEIEQFSDAFANLASHGFRSPQAAAFTKNVFNTMEAEGFIAKA